MVFCFTYLTYNGQRIFRLSKYKKIGERLKWVVKYEKILRISSLILALVGFSCMFYINTESWFLLVIMGFLSLFYVVPIPFINKGLRDISFIKVFIIALVWSLIIFGLPYIDSSPLKLESHTIIAFIQCFLFIIAITLPFDIRDLKYDESSNLKTIPQLVGIKNTIIISEILLIGSLACFYFLELESHILVALTVGHLITMTIIALTNKNRKELFYAGWIESTVIILWLCVLIADFLFSP